MNTNNYFPDGFPVDPYEILDIIPNTPIEDALLDFSEDKQSELGQWKLWLQNPETTQESIEEFVATLHTIWEEMTQDQRDNILAANPKYMAYLEAEAQSEIANINPIPTPPVTTYQESVKPVVESVKQNVEVQKPFTEKTNPTEQKKVERNEYKSSKENNNNQNSKNSSYKANNQQNENPFANSNSGNNLKSAYNSQASIYSNDNKKESVARPIVDVAPKQVTAKEVKNEIPAYQAPTAPISLPVEPTPVESTKSQNKEVDSQTEQKKNLSVQDNQNTQFKSFDVVKVRETSTKLELETVYQQYLDAKEANNLYERSFFESQSVLLDKIIHITLNFEQVADYFEQMTEKLLDMNDKIIQQGREMQAVKSSILNKYSDIEDSLNILRDDTRHFDRDLRDLKTISARRYQELSDKTSHINNDSFGESDTLNQKLKLLEGKLIKLEQASGQNISTLAASSTASFNGYNTLSSGKTTNQNSVPNISSIASIKNKN